MAVEDHPKFSEWKIVLERLLEVKAAFRDRVATQAELDKALEDYHKIADEL